MPDRYTPTRASEHAAPSLLWLGCGCAWRVRPVPVTRYGPFLSPYSQRAEVSGAASVTYPQSSGNGNRVKGPQESANVTVRIRCACVVVFDEQGRLLLVQRGQEPNR